MGEFNIEFVPVLRWKKVAHFGGYLLCAKMCKVFQFGTTHGIFVKKLLGLSGEGGAWPHTVLQLYFNLHWKLV